MVIRWRNSIANNVDVNDDDNDNDGDDQDDADEAYGDPLAKQHCLQQELFSLPPALSQISILLLALFFCIELLAILH